MIVVGDRFRGSLVGAAVGDALGAPFEGAMSVEASVLQALNCDPGPLRYTDDTHMTFGLAQSLVDMEGFDGAPRANLFAINYDAEPWRGYGVGPPQVFTIRYTTRALELGSPYPVWWPRIVW